MAIDDRVFEVAFVDHSIKTTVTSFHGSVTKWINNIEHMHQHRLNRLIVGLDIEWRPQFYRNAPRNPVALLQFCVGHHCLIFQLQYAYMIPRKLFTFLNDRDYTFVGVGIDDDAQKLFEDYDLLVANTVDLRALAVARLQQDEFHNVGLTALANEVLGVVYNKSRNITTSNWSEAELSLEQVEYACIDAFLSFEIGKSLNAAN